MVSWFPDGGFGCITLLLPERRVLRRTNDYLNLLVFPQPVSFQTSASGTLLLQPRDLTARQTTLTTSWSPRRQIPSSTILHSPSPSPQYLNASKFLHHRILDNFQFAGILLAGDGDLDSRAKQSRCLRHSYLRRRHPFGRRISCGAARSVARGLPPTTRHRTDP